MRHSAVVLIVFIALADVCGRPRPSFTAACRKDHVALALITVLVLEVCSPSAKNLVPRK